MRKRKETKEFTKTQIEDLIQWFRDHWDEVPESMKIDKSTTIPKLRETLPKLVDCVKLNWYKPMMRGYVHMLLKIKRNMLQNIK